VTQQSSGAPRFARIGLAAILIAFCALATLQSLATRLQWGPDEPGHIIYVESLALDGRFPTLTHGEEENAYLPGAARTHESHQPPLYYALAALVWRAFRGLLDQMVTFTDQTGAQQRFVAPGPVRPVRLLSVVFGATALLLIWATARTVFPGRPEIWLSGTALIAFTPMFTYVSGVINNDSLLTVAFAATAWSWARMLRFGARTKDLLLLGALLGLAMNVKETAIALVPLSLLVVGLEPGAQTWPRRLRNAAAVLAITVAIAAWWSVRKWLIYGSPFVYPYIYPLLGLPEEQRAVLLSALPERIFQFAFVPADVVARHLDVALLTRFLVCLVALAAGGLVLALARRKQSPMPRYEAVCLIVWVATALVVLLGLLRNVMTVDWRMGTSGGRYLVCVLPLLALTAAKGLDALFGEGRWARLGLALVCLLMLALNVLTILATAAEYGTL
jgi:4-amino-4-deoxy-L-arabinose transferase-like glycosyltransferase